MQYCSSNNTREDSTHGHHQIVNTEIRLIIFFAAKDGEALYRQQKQYWELTVAQIMNSLLPNSDLKKVGKTTRPFKYDLNQIPYDYTVEVRNRFKGLDLIDRFAWWCQTSLVAQRVKPLPAMRETWVRSLGWEDPVEKEMATHSSTLAWKIPWTEEPDRLQSMGSQRVGYD